MFFGFEFMAFFVTVMIFIIFVFVLIMTMMKFVRSQGGKSSVKIIVDGKGKTEEPPKEIRCPYCGAPIHESDAKCEYCGSRL